ncbi:hypothetical protein MRB53_000798 [Persea americana]|uniref:Uncharacterized protein n=1 Tax=Persea americana TaxID=3435 RepID=A0ACC2MQ57_PERAE|nr:hypothetical protein MRB53_000798 [Persea americana]
MLKSAYSAGYDVLVPTTPLSCVFFSTQQFQGLACVLTYAPLSSFFFPSPIWFRYSSPGSGNERKTRKDLFFPGGKKMI